MCRRTGLQGLIKVEATFFIHSRDDGGERRQGIKPLRHELALALAKGHTCRQELCVLSILALLVCGSSRRLELMRLLESISLIPKDGTRLLGRIFLFSGFAVILFSASPSRLSASLQNLSTVSWKALCLYNSYVYNVLERFEESFYTGGFLLHVSLLCFLSSLLFFFKSSSVEEMEELRLICELITLKI